MTTKQTNPMTKTPKRPMNATITSITFKRPAALVNVYSVVLSDGRTMDAFGSTEEAAIAPNCSTGRRATR